VVSAEAQWTSVGFWYGGFPIGSHSVLGDNLSSGGGRRSHIVMSCYDAA
jgi:hypothetical protein